MTKTELALQKIGLNEKESRVYLAALSKGPTSVIQLSKLSGIKRTTLYAVIDSLVSKGLFNIQTKGFKKLYAAENPQKLEKVYEDRRKILDSVIPELSSQFYNLKDQESFIKHYKDLDGVKSIYDKLLSELNPKDFYYVISDQEKWISLDFKYFENFKKKRSKLNLDIKLLLQDSPSARKNLKLKKNYNENLKILPKDIVLNTNMIIVPHKVIIIQTLGPIMGMVIENQSVVQMNKVMFEMMWKNSVNS